MKVAKSFVVTRIRIDAQRQGKVEMALGDYIWKHDIRKSWKDKGNPDGQRMQAIVGDENKSESLLTKNTDTKNEHEISSTYHLLCLPTPSRAITVEPRNSHLPSG